MSRVSEMVEAISHWSSEELRLLRGEVERLEKLRRAWQFNLDGVTVRMTHLDEEDYYALSRRSIAIKEDGFFLFELLYRSRYSLWLAEMFFTLTEIYGKTSRYYDNYKGSFAFPFLLEVIKGTEVYPYIFRVRDWKGTPEFPLRKLVFSAKEADYSIHPPLDNEFSQTEINFFIAYFVGYLEGRFEVLWKSGTKPEPFCRSVPSNHILYGYDKDSFFEHHYESADAYQQACQQYAVIMQAED